MPVTDFIAKADYLYQIKTYKLDQITEATDSVLDSAEDEAIGQIIELLSGRYDVNTEFAKTGANRNKALLRWTKCLVMYYIYERIPDVMVPERIIKNYDDTMELLNKISDGKMNTTLAQLTESDTDGNTEPLTKNRWGSQPKRTQGDRPINVNKFGTW